MNDAEHNGQLLAATLLRVGKLEARVDALESGAGRCLTASRRTVEAVDLARKLGLSQRLFWEPKLRAERCSLARALQNEQWTRRAIAGVLSCTERTVIRLLAVMTPPARPVDSAARGKG